MVTAAEAQASRVKHCSFDKTSALMTINAKYLPVCLVFLAVGCCSGRLPGSGAPPPCRLRSNETRVHH